MASGSIATSAAARIAIRRSNGSAICPSQWTKGNVTPDRKAFLRSLQPEIRFEADGKRFRLVHGSPRRMNEYLFEDRPLSSFQRLAATSETDVLVFGHTHKPYTQARRRRPLRERGFGRQAQGRRSARVLRRDRHGGRGERRVPAHSVRRAGGRGGHPRERASRQVRRGSRDRRHYRRPLPSRYSCAHTRRARTSTRQQRAIPDENLHAYTPGDGCNSG